MLDGSGGGGEGGGAEDDDRNHLRIVMLSNKATFYLLGTVEHCQI
jgi:hypothetical protein